MENPGLIIMLAVAALLALLGWLIRFRRMYGLISGYNTMSKEKKRNVDIERLGVLFGNCLFAMAGLLAGGTLLLKLGQGLLGSLVLALLAPVVVYLIVAGQKFDGNTRTASGRPRPGSQFLVGFIVISIVVLVGFVGILLFRGFQPAAVAFDGGKVSVSGLYGQQIAAADMRQVELVDTLPKILRRTNGSAVGDQLGGHFTMEGIGPVMLYLNRSRPPFIYIETATNKVYLNAGTPDETRSLYERIQAAKR